MLLTKIIIIFTMYFFSPHYLVSILFIPILFIELNTKLVHLYRFIIAVCTVVLLINLNWQAVFVLTTIFLVHETNRKYPQVSIQYYKFLQNAQITYLKNHLNTYLARHKELPVIILVASNNKLIIILVLIHLLLKVFATWHKDSKKKIVYYDADCYFCLKVLYSISQVVQNRNIHYVPNTEISPEDITENQLNTAKFMYVKTEDRYYAGYHAFIQIFSTLQLFMLVKPLFTNKITVHFGEKVYDKISAMRGTQLVCKIN